MNSRKSFAPSMGSSHQMSKVPIQELGLKEKSRMQVWATPSRVAGKNSSKVISKYSSKPVDSNHWHTRNGFGDQQFGSVQHREVIINDLVLLSIFGSRIYSN